MQSPWSTTYLSQPSVVQTRALRFFLLMDGHCSLVVASREAAARSDGSGLKSEGKASVVGSRLIVGRSLSSHEDEEVLRMYQSEAFEIRLGLAEEDATGPMQPVVMGPCDAVRTSRRAGAADTAMSAGRGRSIGSYLAALREAAAAAGGNAVEVALALAAEPWLCSVYSKSRNENMDIWWWSWRCGLRIAACWASAQSTATIRAARECRNGSSSRAVQLAK